MSIKTLCALAITLSLVGCSYTPQRPIQPIDPAEAKIAEAASSVSHSMYTMAEVEEAASPKPDLTVPPKPSSYGMGNVASVDWTGPIEPFINKLAHATGYQLKVFGKSPAIPVIVSIYAKNEALGSILRNAGLQAGKKADVIVYPSRRIIELRYLS